MKLKLQLFAGLFFCITVPLTSSAQCDGTLIWSDEFTGSALDGTKWGYELGNGCPNLCQWGNAELEYYTNSTNNVSVSNGILTIKAIKENQGGSSFTSGKIRTYGKFGHTYGKYEARVRLPQGRGLWPAFWMLRTDNNWPMTGEIDIMEYRGDKTAEVNGTLHYGSAYPNNQHDGGTYTLPSGNFYSDWHLFSVEWDTNEIRWYVDGQNYKTETKNPNSLNPASTNNPWPWENDFYIILNLAVGGWYTGTTDPVDVQLTKPTFEIDYVRVYDMKQTPYVGSATLIPAKIEAENFDLSCGEGSYSDADAVNNGNVYRNHQVDIQACTDAGGGYNIGWTETGEWSEYTINVPANGAYDFSFRAASGASGGTLHAEIDGVNVTGSVAVSSTGGWQSWQNFVKQNVNLTSGKKVMRLVFETGGINLNYINVSAASVTAVHSTAENESWKVTSSDGVIHILDPALTLQEVRLLDVNGKVMMMRTREGHGEMTISASAFVPGVYFVYLTSGNYASVRKIVIP